MKESKSGNGSFISDRVFRAFQLAWRAHRGQYRKGTDIPYIVHPINVAKTLFQWSSDEDLVIAGLLHDVIEDTPVDLKTIEQEFGEHIANLVKAASQDKRLPWETRKSMEIEKIKNLPIEVVLLLLADKLDNIRDIHIDYLVIGDELWNRFNRPVDKQKWYYTSLARAFINRLKGTKFESLAILFQTEVKETFK